MSHPDVVMLTDSDSEDEPEEELTRRSPVRGTYGPQTIQRAGKEVATSSTPTYDINFPPEPIISEPVASKPVAPRPPANLGGNDIQAAVEQWMYEEGFPTINEAGESSSAPQRFPSIKESLTPIISLIIARMIRHEIRIGHMDDNIARLPEAEEVVELQAQTSNLEKQLKGVQGDTDDLRRRMMEGTIRTVDIGQRITRIENRLVRLEAIAESIKDFAAHLVKKDHDPK